MQNAILLPATERTPEIDFNFEANTFTLRGESYPEDVNAFFGPIITRLKEHLTPLKQAEIRFSFELVYFNSSSAKILMGLFDFLDEIAGKGNAVNIAWVFEEDDDNMAELGEEFCEILEHATHELIPIEAP